MSTISTLKTAITSATSYLTVLNKFFNGVNNMNPLKLQHYINHISFVLDRSGSMAGNLSKLELVFDNEIEHLRQRSIELDQETRISIYTFQSQIECLVFDMDVMRIKKLAGQIQSAGMTALMDATWQSINDMQHLPELYGDHAFLVYVLTDGEENASKKIRLPAFRNALTQLKDNWTIAVMVPDSRGVFEAKKFGFPQNNIQIWSPTSAGIQEVGRETRSALDNYMHLRSQGIRSTKSFYSTDLSATSPGLVSAVLTEVSPRDYSIFRVAKGPAVIREFVEAWTGKPYRIGSSYYELVKKEEVQPSKQIAIMNRMTGKVFSGTNARSLLQLPSGYVNVAPGDHGDWRIFIQSTSVNRKLPSGTDLLVMQ
jgi:hypothetical protein